MGDFEEDLILYTQLVEHLDEALDNAGAPPLGEWPLWAKEIFTKKHKSRKDIYNIVCVWLANGIQNNIRRNREGRWELFSIGLLEVLFPPTRYERLVDSRRAYDDKAFRNLHYSMAKQWMEGTLIKDGAKIYDFNEGRPLKWNARRDTPGSRLAMTQMREAGFKRPRPDDWDTYGTGVHEYY